MKVLVIPDVHLNYDEAVKSISEALTEDFCVALKYRDKKINNNYDTFMSCIYGDTFLIFLWKDQSLQLIDHVKKVPTFLQLYQYADMW